MAFRNKQRNNSINRSCQHQKDSRTQALNLENLESRLLLDGSTIWGIADTFYSCDDPDAVFYDQDDTLITKELTSGSEQSQYNDVLPARAPNVLYLDFDGGTVKSRSGDFWLGQSKIEIDAFDLSSFNWSGYEAQAREIIMNFIKEDYAAYNLVVTDVEPSSGEYTTIYVGGDNSWFRAGSNVIGVATYDIGNRDDSNYGFAFVEELDTYYSASGGDLTIFCEYVANLIAHEAAHTYGANHVSDPTYLMNPYLAIRPVTTGFGGDSGQDTEQLLTNNLGSVSSSGDDYGDDERTATKINATGSISGLLENRSDVDAFSLIPANSGVITVDLDTSIYGNLDATITIYHVDTQKIIAQNDNYGGQVDPWLSFNAIGDETYIVYIASASEQSSGTYELSIDMPAAPPQLTIEENSGVADDLNINLGTVTVGSAVSASITLGNSGYDDLVISQLSVSGGFTLDHLSGMSGDDDIIITPGDTLTVTITLDPDSSGEYLGILTVVSNDPDQEQMTVSVAAQALDPQSNIDIAGLTDNAIHYGNIHRGLGLSRVITVCNTGTLDLVLGDVIASNNFEVVSVSSNTIAPGQSGSVIVTITGTVRGLETGVLTIFSNDPDQPVTTLSLSAQIVAGELAVTEDCGIPNDNLVEFPTVYLGETVTRSVTISNSGDASLTLEAIDSEGEFNIVNYYSLTGYMLQPGESLELTLSFSPDVEGHYQGNVVLTTDDSQVQSSLQIQALVEDNPIQIISGTDNMNESIHFGSVQTGEQAFMEVWTIINHGNQSARITLSLTGSNAFYLIGGDTVTIEPGQSIVVQAGIDTLTACPVSGSLILAADDYHETKRSVSLDAEVYAQIGNGNKYQFTDHDGDEVTVSLSGKGTARLVLGDDGQVDIAQIVYNGADDGDVLKIKVSGDYGTTTLGSLVGTGNLQKFDAASVAIHGGDIDLEGAITRLKLGDLVDANVAYHSMDRNGILDVDSVSGDSRIDIAGRVKTIKIDNFEEGILQVDSVDKASFGTFGAQMDVRKGDLDKMTVKYGDVTGQVNVSGSIKYIKVAQGNLDADLNVGNQVGRIICSRGSINGQVVAGDEINRIIANDYDPAVIQPFSQVDELLNQLLSE